MTTITTLLFVYTQQRSYGGASLSTKWRAVGIVGQEPFLSTLQKVDFAKIYIQPAETFLQPAKILPPYFAGQIKSTLASLTAAGKSRHNDFLSTRLRRKNNQVFYAQCPDFIFIHSVQNLIVIFVKQCTTFDCFYYCMVLEIKPCGLGSRF